MARKPPLQIERDEDADEPLLTDPDHAPIIYFDGVGPYGHYNGIVHLTLGAYKHLPSGDGENDVLASQVATAFLRCNIEGALALKDAIDAALLMAAPVEGEAN
jgi:hypothetical protein